MSTKLLKVGTHSALWSNGRGPSRLDNYLFDFLIREVAHRAPSIEEIAAWQKTFAKLFVHAVVHGTASEQLGNLTFQQMREHTRNAEETLLAALNACARHTQQVSDTEWPIQSFDAFGNWLFSVQGQRTSPENTVSLLALSHIKLNHLQLATHDFYGANLAYTELRRAELTYTIL